MTTRTIRRSRQRHWDAATRKEHRMNTKRNATAGTLVLLSLACGGMPLSWAGDDAQAGAPACKYCPEPADWSAWIQGGMSYRSEDAFRAGRFDGGTDQGVGLSLSGSARHNGPHGRFLEVEADDLGQDGREVRIEGGRQGMFSATLDYQGRPNNDRSGGVTPYSDNGGVLTLPATWVWASDTSGMTSLPASLQSANIKTKRDQFGTSFSLTPTRHWELSGLYRRDMRDGNKDTGATFGFGQTAILAAPVEDQTDTLGLALGYTGERFQARLAYDGSLYSNDRRSLNWQNAYVATGDPTGFGQMATAPDNQFHQISASLGVDVLESTRVTGQVALGRMTQNEALLAYSVNPTYAALVLPTSSAEGEVATTLARLEVNSRPMPRLTLNAGYTYSDRDNDTPQNTYTFVLTDLGMNPYTATNLPYSFEQQLWRAKAAYRVGNT
ncbi:MAG: MtrB/PioB family decaheme-associated outer membrane protein, partial [Magnetococcus sp. WYHC-3]